MTRPPRRAARAAWALLAASVLAACSGPAHPHSASGGARRVTAAAGASGHAAPTVLPSTTPASRASSAAPTAAPSPSAAPSATPSASEVAVPPPAPACSTAALAVRAGAANGAAGSIYYPLEFTNISRGRCSLQGYPGVSFVSGPGGRQLGGAAARNATFPPLLVSLAPGAVAHASVQVVVAQNYPTATCRPVTAHWLRVYPPGQYAPLYAGLTAQTCTGSIPGGSTLGIYVVRPGATGP